MRTTNPWLRIEGHHARKLSFWIQHADFVRQCQTIDGLWPPEKDQTLVQVRLYGKKTLKIEHENGVVIAGQGTNALSTVRENAVSGLGKNLWIAQVMTRTSLI